MTIRCEIVSQDRTVFQGDVDIVILRALPVKWGFCLTMPLFLPFSSMG